MTAPLAALLHDLVDVAGGFARLFGAELQVAMRGVAIMLVMGLIATTAGLGVWLLLVAAGVAALVAAGLAWHWAWLVAAGAHLLIALLALVVALRQRRAVRFVATRRHLRGNNPLQPETFDGH
ncbi:MAG TPA: hypothetical protein QF361_07575 [Gammaproteobacteria bacterium]|nr:hypothetical protein [Gammaproteobacteria bacterium]